MNKFFLSSILSLVFLVPVMTSAHDFGESFEKQVTEDVLIDIGYSVEEFTTDASVIFDFELVDSREEQIDFESVWVRIVYDGATIFASGIENARLGGALMTQFFSREGAYELHVRYQNGIESVAEAMFPFEVVRGTSEARGGNGALYAAAGFFGGILLGVIPLIALRKREV